MHFISVFCSFRAPLKTYQDRDEHNFDFELGDSVHRRAGSPSCADQRSSEPKVFRFERLAACCALAALLSPRQGFQPNRWRESLACITASRQSRHMGGFKRCPLAVAWWCFMKTRQFLLLSCALNVTASIDNSCPERCWRDRHPKSGIWGNFS